MAVKQRLLRAGKAAALLEVHRNTLLNWTKHGIIQAITFPSGEHRFEVQEVERVKKGYFAGLPLPPSDRTR